MALRYNQVGPNVVTGLTSGDQIIFQYTFKDFPVFGGQDMWCCQAATELCYSEESIGHLDCSCKRRSIGFAVDPADSLALSLYNCTSAPRHFTIRGSYSLNPSSSSWPRAASSALFSSASAVSCLEVGTIHFWLLLSSTLKRTKVHDIAEVI